MRRSPFCDTHQDRAPASPAFAERKFAVRFATDNPMRLPPINAFPIQHYPFRRWTKPPIALSQSSQSGQQLRRSSF
jgi:hypothetical protein